MRTKKSPSEYLAFLTIKYSVDADKFFDALISAGKKQKSECGSLSIECRSKQSRKIIFLITQNQKVVAQFQLPEDFLSMQNNPIKEARKACIADKYSTKKDKAPQQLQIENLRIGMKGINLRAKVVEVSKPTFVVTRFGNCASVANAMVSDDTGKIKLCLWNDQINSIAVGDTVQIENARISAFKNEKQMRIGKKGILRITPPNSRV